MRGRGLGRVMCPSPGKKKYFLYTGSVVRVSASSLLIARYLLLLAALTPAPSALALPQRNFISLVIDFCISGPSTGNTTYPGPAHINFVICG